MNKDHCQEDYSKLHHCNLVISSNDKTLIFKYLDISLIDPWPMNHECISRMGGCEEVPTPVR